jgi:Ca-activated chloride channel family protein
MARGNRRLNRFAWMSFGLLLLAPAWSQQPDEPIATLKIGTRLVSVSALVHDKSGAPVSGLTKDDFLLKEDGKPQDIRFFSQGSDLPLTLALMVDTSGSQRDFIDDEIAASHVFLHTVLANPEDRAVLIQFDSRVRELQRMTNSVSYLERALVHLSEPDPGPRGSRRGGTLLYDAICAVSGFEMQKQSGRRAMVILTDGGDNGSTNSIQVATACAQAMDTVIYSVFYADHNGRGGRKDVLDDLSRATGGRVFTVGPKSTLEQIYAEIAAEMRLQYLLGYRPPDSKPKKFHKIEVKAKDKKLTVLARQGYYTPE